MKQEDVKPGQLSCTRKYPANQRQFIAIWNIIPTGPPSTIIQDRPGFHTDAERRAHIHLVLQQRADLERIAGYDRMIAHISLLNQVNDRGKLQRAREHAQRVKSWQLCDRRGKREVPHKPLTEDDLYLDEVRPEEVSFPRILHTCGICLNAKSHPVRSRPYIYR